LQHYEIWTSVIFVDLWRKSMAELNSDRSGNALSGAGICVLIPAVGEALSRKYQRRPRRLVFMLHCSVKEWVGVGF
jgi:hypothetical protein